MSACAEESIVSSILLRSGKGGLCRVFIVQTRNHAEVGQVQQIFGELENYCSVRALSLGVTTAFAVQTSGDLPLLQEVEALLKEHYKFSVVYAGFNEVIHRIVEDLAVETGSQLLSIPICQSCGETDPFPTQLTLQGPGRKPRARAVFCDHCVAAIGGDGEAEEFCRLLDARGADLGDLTTTPATEVVRKRSLLRQRPSRRASRQRDDCRSEQDSAAAMEEKMAAEPVRLAS